MPKVKSQKEVLLQKYKELIEQSNGFIAVDAAKINNATVTELKKKLKQGGSNYIVVKNTLFKLALQDKAQPTQSAVFDGETGIITFTDDPTAIAKLIKDTQTKSQLLAPKFGVVEGTYVDEKGIMNLASIPSKPELLAKLLGSFNAPLSGLMNAVTGNVKGFTRVLQGMSEKK